MMRYILLIVVVLFLAQHFALATTSVAQVKLTPDFDEVSLDGVVATLTFPGYFYVQDGDNVGMRINSAMPISRGARCNITGTIGTMGNGERCIDAGAVSVTGSGVVKPVLIRTKDLGGADHAYDSGGGTGQIGVTGGIGANNVGAYVRLCGRVIAPGVIEGGGVAIRLLLPAGVGSPDRGCLISVSGISSLIAVGQELRGALAVADGDTIHVEAGSSQTTPYAGEMIYIPAGSFLMGAVPTDHDPLPSEKPQHTVYLDAFYIAKYELTRGEYRKFIAAGGYNNNAYWSDQGWYYRNHYGWNQPAWWEDSWLWNKFQFQTDDHPVVGVSWYEAEAYCNWAGLRLPTEAEWEKTAHWNLQTSAATLYPWGNDWHADYCNNWLDSVYAGTYTAPVGSYPLGASHYGCMDMAGNVWEWVSDWMGPTYYQQTPPGGWVNPQGPPENAPKTKVLKGGSWWGDYPGVYCSGGAVSSRRNESFARWNEYPNQWGGRQGFRVAR